jgi:RecJ-like exonuclease
MQKTEIIDWNALSAFGRKKINKKILSLYPKARVFSHESYALDLYEKMMGFTVTKKDFKDGDIFRLKRVISADGTNITFEIENGLQVEIDFSKERKYCSIYDLEPNEFAMWLKGDGSQYFESQPKIMLSGSGNSLKGDLYKAHIAKIQEEFLNQITDSNLAYTAKIIAKNKGGFMINVLGIDGFLPGGLAAANKIIDFDSFIGKKVTVMVEDYLQDTKTFVFSNKKYLNKVLPDKMRELSTEQNFTGNVTGTSKFGIFVEFDEIFTGLLHASKMSAETRARFDERKFKPGDEISFWVKEITNDNRIILSEEDPSIRIAEFEDFKSKNIGVIHNGKVIKNIPFGTLVKIEKDLVGLISKQELKSKDKNFQPGDEVIVSVNSVKKDKIYFSLIDENQKLQQR